MDSLIINGGKKLRGSVDVSVAKNSSLPILISCLLSKDSITLNNLPSLRDMSTTFKLLKNLGAEIQESDGHHVINCAHIKSTEAHSSSETLA